MNKTSHDLVGSCQGEEYEEQRYGPNFNDGWSVEMICKLREQGYFNPFAPAASGFALSQYGLKFLQDNGLYLNSLSASAPALLRANTPKPLNGNHRSVEEQRRIDESLASNPRDSPE